MLVLRSLSLVVCGLFVAVGFWWSLDAAPVRRLMRPDGPRGFLLPLDCEQCRLDFRLGHVSEPHGHTVHFIEPGDGLRRDGVFWRFLWQGNEAVCSREGFAFLPSQQPCPDAYRAWKEGRGREYADVLYTPMPCGE